MEFKSIYDDNGVIDLGILEAETVNIRILADRYAEEGRRFQYLAALNEAIMLPKFDWRLIKDCIRSLSDVKIYESIDNYLAAHDGMNWKDMGYKHNEQLFRLIELVMGNDIKYDSGIHAFCIIRIEGS